MRACIGVLRTMLMTGCVSVLPHHPDTSVVESIGADAANTELKALLLRSHDPPFIEAEVHGGVLYYTVEWQVFATFHEERELQLGA